MQGIFLWLFLLKKVSEPFSVPMTRTGWVWDQLMYDAVSLLEASSMS